MVRYYKLKALFLSFFSKGFYRDVLNNRKGLGFGYLFFINIIAVFLLASYYVLQIYKIDTKDFSDDVTRKMFEESNLTFEENLNRLLDIVSQLPDARIDNGNLSVYEDEPYYVTDPVSGRDILIFDTTGYYSGLEKTDAVMLFTKNKIISKNSEKGEQAYYISEITSEDANESDFNLLFYILSQIPKVTIVNGIASIDEETPYYIKNHEDKTLAIIDTDGDHEPLKGQDALLLITDDKIYAKDIFVSEDEGSSIKQIAISDINANTIYDFIEMFSSNVRSFLLWFVPLLVFPLITIFSFVMLLISVLIIAIITWLLGSSVAKIQEFEYEKAIRLTSFAITPVFFASKLLPDLFPNQGLFYFVIMFGYIYFAVNANAVNKRS